MSDRQVKCSAPGCIQTATCPKSDKSIGGKPVSRIPNGWVALVPTGPAEPDADTLATPIKATADIQFYCPQHINHANPD